MRAIASLNRLWRYNERFDASYVDPSTHIGDWPEVELPHANRLVPYNGFDEAEYQFISCYARDIVLGPEAFEAGRRVFLDFEGVMAACELWLDGRRIGSHEGGYTPFSVEITGLARENVPSRLVVKVDSTERPDIPPFGFVVDYLCYGGIYREAWLRVQESALIAELFAQPERTLKSAKALSIDVDLDLGPSGAAGEGGLEAARDLEVAAALRDGARLVASETARVEGASIGGRAKALLYMEGLEGLRNWDLDDPALYELEVELRRAGSAAALDVVRTRVGFREAEFRPEGFFLNGRRRFLVGLDRHQSYPYVGYAMPARVQRRDAEILKKELAVDIVRASHYPQSRHFLDACDELGLLVFEELPGWQHIGDAAWKARAELALEEMIRRDRNHPCVALWGTRINESADDHEFYERTSDLARRLDQTRQTSGVRAHQKSELLEDLYSYNDFTHSGGRAVIKRPASVTGSRRVPYLITEHDGHMFPTKRFDNEERLVEQALRHLRVISAASRAAGISGAIGWCAFDYNTHKDFGSGDRICYHGVSDMFRIPKYAAWAYASRRDPSKGPVLEAASLFAKGERQAARLLPIYVFTNCDEVVLYRAGRRIGSYLPDREEFPGLEHPPVAIRDLIGDQLEGERFSPHDARVIRRVAGKALSVGVEGLSPLEMLAFGRILLRYRISFADAEGLVAKYAVGWGQKDERFDLVGLVGGKEAIRRSYGGDARASRLAMVADDAVLESGEGWDATRVVLRLEDQYGNLCPFVPESVDVEVDGPLAVLGPSRLSLIGGCIAFWLRTTGSPGAATVRARGTRFEAESLTVELR